MGLSARTDDFNGQPLGEGYIILATSAFNGLVFQSPATANSYKAANPAQFSKPNNNTGGYNTETALPQS